MSMLARLFLLILGLAATHAEELVRAGWLLGPDAAAQRRAARRHAEKAFGR